MCRHRPRRYDSSHLSSGKGCRVLAKIQSFILVGIDAQLCEVEADVSAAGLHDEGPIFDCRDCGFEWGEAVRDLLS